MHDLIFLDVSLDVFFVFSLSGFRRIVACIKNAKNVVNGGKRGAGAGVGVDMLRGGDDSLR